MTYKEKREEKLQELLSDTDNFGDALDYIEREIASAFGRGVRHARQHPAEGKDISALQAGKLKRKEEVA